MTELYIKMISHTEHPLENRKRRQSDCTQQYCASLEEKELIPGRRSISGRLSAGPGDWESKGRPAYGVNVPVASIPQSSCTILYLPTGISVDFREKRNNYIYLPALLPALPISCGPLPSSNVHSGLHMNYFPEFSHCCWRVRLVNLCSSSRVSQIRIIVQIPA